MRNKIRNSFKFYSNFSDAIESEKYFNEQQKLEAYRALCLYGIYGVEPDDLGMRMFCKGVRISIEKMDKNNNPSGNNQHSKYEPKIIRPIENNESVFINQKDFSFGSMRESFVKEFGEPIIKQWELRLRESSEQPEQHDFSTIREWIILSLKPESQPQKIKKFELSFCKTIDEIDLCNTWLQYKSNKRKSYKDIKSIELFYKNLCKLGNNDIQKMRAIIEQSMANNWDGIFALKTEKPVSRMDTLTRGMAMADKIMVGENDTR